MKWLVTCILCISSLALYAQPFAFKSYTTLDGLSSNNILAGISDRQGFLWLATNNGLNRFDGNAFDVFYNNPRDVHSLASNEVQALCIDRQQRMWVGSVGGISLYHPRQQQFTNYYPDSSTGKCGRWFCTLQSDDAGQLWVGSWYELLIFDPPTGKFRRSGWADYAATHKPADGNNSRVVIIALVKKGPQELWVLTTYGLYSVHTATGQFQWYPYTGLSDYYGCQLNHIDAEGRLWLGTYNKGILCFNTRTQSWNSYLPPPAWNSAPGYNCCYAITPLAGDTLLYAGVNYLGLFHKGQGRFITRVDTAHTGTVPMVKTGMGHWLLGSNGLTLMKPAQTWLKAVEPFGPGNFINKIYTLQHQPHVLVIGYSSRRQIGLLDKQTNHFTPFTNPAGTTFTMDLSGWLQVSDSLAYMTTEEELYRVNLVTLQATPIQLPPKQVSANLYLLRNMVADNSGSIWVRARGQGFLRYNPTTNQIAYVNFISPAQDRAYSALYYNAVQQCLWAGVEHEGVYQYNIHRGSVSHYLLADPSREPVADITSISGTAAGNLFMTDVVRGLYYYDIAAGRFTLYNRQNELPSNNCYFACPDVQDQPWIITGQGLVRMNMHTGLAERYEHGKLPEDRSNFLHRSSDGTMYTCAGSYYYYWQPAQLPGRAAWPPLYLRSIRINNQPAPIDSSYSLHFSQNNISLQVGAITTGTEEPVNFEYALNKSPWMPVENSHTLNFSNLAAGSYLLRLRQKGDDAEMILHIRINPPWWRTSWFWALALLTAGAIIFLLIRRRISAIRKQAMLKQKIAETETMALRAQMNPHFIFNCISSIDNFIQDNDKENASAWLNKFARLIRSILDNSRQEVIPFWKDWETLQLYTELELLRANHAFSCRLEADEALLNGHYRIPPLIIQPYVENAIHHGLRHRHDENGRLTITARLQGQQLVFTIEDNGIGRKKAAELKAFNAGSHNSIGMQLSGDRIHLFNAAPGHIIITDLADENGYAAGTRVQISLSV